MKETMMQYFQWNTIDNDNGQLWNLLTKAAPELAATGITMLWLPPAYKGQNSSGSVGYDVYDMYDLGEFDQKGSVKTGYGSKNEYLKAVKAAQKNGMKVLADIVFNHRMGADRTEHIQACNVERGNRNNEQAPHDVQVWTQYDFEGRDGKYSDFKWDASNFTSTDYDQNTGSNEIIQFKGKSWNDNVSKEQGNFDFIMGNDVDFNNDEVKKELYDWGKWYTKFTGVDGFRLDAVKSIDSHFFKGWLKDMQDYGKHPVLAVGEYWSGNPHDLQQYLSDSGHCMRLFDAPLHFRLQQAAQSNGSFDIRRLYDDTITAWEPDYAVAFVDNHDTQPGQGLESWVDDWFKPQAYAAVLLNRCQEPCVFYGDYYGMPEMNKGPVPFIKEMIWIRKNLLSDDIVDMYDDDPQKACWLARSDEHPVFVIYTTSDWKQKNIVEPDLAGKTFVDVTDAGHTVPVGDDGSAEFTCKPGGCSVYILDSDYDALKKELYES